MTKTLNHIIFFFPPPKSEYFFQQHCESEYFFRKKQKNNSERNKKKHNPPFKLNGRSLMLNSGKKIRALGDKKNKCSNSCVVRKKNFERNKKP
jgi:hypothetical protein